MRTTYEKHTVSVADAKTMAAILAACIMPEATEGMDHEKAIKAKARLGKSHGQVVRGLKDFDDQFAALADKHAERKGDKKVEATQRVKDEETGEWVDQPTGGYRIADPEAYIKELRELQSEVFEVELSIIPLEWLEGNTQIGALCSVCPMMIRDDD